MKYKTMTTLAIAFILSALIVTTSTAGTKSVVNFKLDYNGNYESNIYHAFADSNVTASLLNVISADATWRYRSSSKYSHKLTTYLDLDYYPSFTKRNRSAIGMRWKPTFRYNSRGRLTGDVDVSRRNRDLIDDSGNIQSRTFKKWVGLFELTNRYDFGDLRLEQTLGYSKYNYDEVLSPKTGLPQLSYDYSGVIYSFLARYDISSHWRTTVIFDSDKRDYDERRTYTLTFGAAVGRPFQIRTFRQNSIDGELEYRFARKNKFSASYEYADRNENFENFYGYTYRQIRLSSTIQVSNRLQTKVSARFKNKDYGNYWTRNIGVNNRVAIDYTDIQFNGKYALSDLLDLTFFVRNYNKTSNDPSFDYNDVTAGTGFTLRY